VTDEPSPPPAPSLPRPAPPPAPAASPNDQHERFMRMALEEARRATLHGDVPVGAVVVQGGVVLAARGNERELRTDPTAHAEMLALRDASAFLGSWRILDATLYVTLEPCAMCAGALVLARVSRLVYGTPDPKAGAAGSVMDLVRHPLLNHRLEVTVGVLAEESAALLQGFFGRKRSGNG
jgi:tRNA(adenine34) deaminase